MRRFFEPGKKRRDELVVALHGYAHAGNRLAAVREAIGEARRNADIYAPELPFIRSWLCSVKAETIVAKLVDDIDQLVKVKAQSGTPYKSITLVGHSFGAVLARKIAIVAFGEQAGAKNFRPALFEPEFHRFRKERSWARLIDRIVLLAGMNRGWSATSATDWITTVQWSILQLIGETVFGGRPTVFAIRRGAPFLVQTRLQWLALMDPKYGPQPKLIVVQLLGTSDDLVAPDDNVDYAVDYFGARGRTSYCYVEVRHSNHANVIQMSADGPPGEAAKHRAERRKKFIEALSASRKDVLSSSIPRSHMSDNLPPEPNEKIKNVVFVIHGIRDKGFWTQKIARTIKKHAPKEEQFESWTESYGYFAMLPFVFPAVRRRKVEWLMDRYAEARARYPRAEFHYVGHSNGTYLAAKALLDYPAARFKHIVFAGSVVRRDYDWLALIKPKDGQPRVGKVLNYVATGDWVVALFPKGMQPWRWFNLGSAGHDGFDQGRKRGPVHQVTYIEGSHGAGHEEEHWDYIARFIVAGEAPPEQFPSFAERQSPFWRVIGEASPVLFPALVLAVLAIGGWILWPLFCQLPGFTDLGVNIHGWFSRYCLLPLGIGEAVARVVSFFLYLWVVYLAITRF